jgi:two-component system chemotaxis response regulator CheB
MQKAPASIVVIGASAGGVEALLRLVASLPVDLPAAICVVIHQPVTARSLLPTVLSRAGTLPASHAVDGEAIHQGHIYVAPPNYQLVVEHGQLSVVQSPRENGHRPAIDPLFRSAARAYGSLVIGVLLSGADDDGTEGLLIIKARGGRALVQDPEEALFARMPTSAMEHVDIDAALPISELAQAIVQEVMAQATAGERLDAMQRNADPEGGRAELEHRISAWGEGEGDDAASGFSCPLCGGGIWVGAEGSLTRFQCHTGHRFSPESFLREQAMLLESTLWQAMRALTEREALLRRLASQETSVHHPGTVSRFSEQAAELARGIELMRQVLQGNATRQPAEEQAT